MLSARVAGVRKRWKGKIYETYAEQLPEGVYSMQ